MADEPDSASVLRRRVSLVGGVLVVATAVSLGWLFLGGGGSGSIAALEQDPGIPPPDYLYLDNLRVVSYLAQIQGGLSTSEKLTQQLTQSQNASVAASGFQLGGSAGQSLSVERVVTPTATARFYLLLDRLQAHGYLHTIDMAARPAVLRAEFAAAPEGSFVQLTSCALAMPAYAQLEEWIRLSHRQISGQDAWNTLQQSGTGMPWAAVWALTRALMIAHPNIPQTGAAENSPGAAVERRVTAALNNLVKAVGPNPRVPFSTCGPSGVDLLFPIRLGDLSPEQSLLAGPVTLVGKLVRAVRGHAFPYVDDASLAIWEGPLSTLDSASQSSGSNAGMKDELYSDVSVLSPGAVILPIAIYK